MMKSMDELKGIISGWASISSAWNDSKSNYIEENVILALEDTMHILETQMDEVSLISKKVEERIDYIERYGDRYGW